jgi:predicted esterase
MKRLFLHGLDSSGFGTKGRYFAETYPDMLRPDFDGSLTERMERLHAIVADLTDLIIVGSSFGGLMATCLAIERPSCVKRLVLLAPALNFSEYQPPPTKLAVQTVLIIGRLDMVTPPDIVVSAAESTFAQLETVMVDDDHLLHDSFRQLDWQALLG